MNIQSHDNDPTVCIRTDLWNSMTIAELQAQQVLFTSHIGSLYTMMESEHTESVRDLLLASQHASAQLTALIEHKQHGPRK